MNSQQHKKQYTLAELASGLDVTIHGDPHCLIDGVCTLTKASPGKITFLINPIYKKYLSHTEASAVILTEKDVTDLSSSTTHALVTKNPHYVYAKIAAYFGYEPSRNAGVHPTAVVEEGASIDVSATIGPYCVIARDAIIGPHVVVGPHCTIGEGSCLGEGTQLSARVTIAHHVRIGKRVRVASGVVIGSDGFGFANQLTNQQGSWHKIEQMGGVDIGDDVDIGANTTIDRGAVENTVIEEGVKLDNLVQVAHNVHIGAHTVIAACVGISGSTTIGKHCMIGGASCFAGHLTVCDNVMMTGLTTVTKSIHAPGLYSSGIVGAIPNHEFLKNNARFNRLAHLNERVKQLESALAALKERETI